MSDSRVLVVVFDALRPDMIDAGTMPNLAAFLGTACRFTGSRAVFPSETRVNTASFATGALPGGHGLVANAFFDPAIPGGRIFDTGKSDMLSVAEAAYGGRLLTAPALADLLHAQGRRYLAVSAGTPGNARMLNPGAAANGQVTFSVHGAVASSPAADVDAVTARFGPIPGAAIPNLPRCRYAATMLLDHYLPAIEPDMAVLWLSEPDIAYHYRGIGSAESLAGMQGVDDLFGEILAHIAARPDADRWTIVAASDHGQVTVREKIDLTGALRAAGFRAGDALDVDTDMVCVVSNSGNIWLRDADPGRAAALVDWLGEQPWCGVLFSAGGDGIHGGVPGTFALDLVGSAHPRMPHLAYTLATDDGPNLHGLPGGTWFGDDALPAGIGGIHGGLHAKELSNLLAARGPGFTAGIDARPCGLIDIAPTVLRAFGLTPAATMVGHVLFETDPGPVERLTPVIVHRGRSQGLSLARRSAAVYIDEGWRR